MNSTTGAEAVAQAFGAAGMPALCGVPGGGSSLDMIAAADALGIPFLLARTETGAGIMALTLAELTGRPTGLLTTRGPGVAAAANGMANAALERASVIMVADALSAAERRFATHQLFDQAALLAPLAHIPASGAPGEAAVAAMTAALGAPRGPAYLELAGDVAHAPCPPPPAWVVPRLPTPAKLEAARHLLAQARRPVLIAGLEAATAAGAAATRRLAEALRCPVLVTYKAKGVLPDAHPLFGGVFTGGEAEAPLLYTADLIVLLGADPVEFIPQPWRFLAPILDLGACIRARDYRAPAVQLTGAWEGAAEALAAGAIPSEWRGREIAQHRDTWLAVLENAPGNAGLPPSGIVRATDAACRRAGRHPRVAVDAGAHMFACTTFWQATAPRDLLISNGLATMGHALPAAIAAAWHDPERGAIAFTGDGGLLMCLGELATAAALGLRLTVVVFNDAALSLIGIKTGGRALPSGALDWPMVDFAQVMRGLGGQAWRADDAAALDAALDAALVADGPTLIDVRCDPGSYPTQIKALRG